MKTLIFFIFIKNEEFCLCINYKNLNVVNVINQHSLLLITKILNRFNKFKLFTKFNFKNIYHRICIKCDNE